MQIVPQPIVILPETDQDELRVEMTGVRVVLSPEPEGEEITLAAGAGIIASGRGTVEASLTPVAATQSPVPPVKRMSPVTINGGPSCRVPPPPPAFGDDFERIHLGASGFAERPMLVRTVPATGRDGDPMTTSSSDESDSPGSSQDNRVPRAAP